MTEYISAALVAQKVAASLLAVLGAIALVLAAVGLYSVMAYSITQRTQEIGIRMALGAGSGDVVRLVLRQGMGLTVVGLAAGVCRGARRHPARRSPAGSGQRERSRDLRRARPYFWRSWRWPRPGCPRGGPRGSIRM